MKKAFTILILFLSFSISLQAQEEDERTPIRGQVIYNNVNVPNENVLNVSSEGYTTTDDNGEFMIDVKIGDIVAFTSLNYKFYSLVISEEQIENGRIIVEVEEKVNQLDEVVITPENTEKFLNAKSEELGAYGEYEYEDDDATEFRMEDNTALPTQVRGLQNGLNIGNIARLLFKKNDENEEVTKTNLQLSEVVLQIYDTDFFVTDLKLPEDKITEFAYYLDDQPFSKDLLKKDNEFQFVDFLVNQSKQFKENLKEE